jgi:hypothetical protein
MNDLPAEKRYDVFLGPRKYAEQVDRRLVMDAVLEILIMKEKGKVAAAHEQIVIVPNNPPKHSEGLGHGGNRGLRALQSIGRAGSVSRPQPSDPIPEDGYSLSPINPAKVDDATQADYLNPLIDDDDMDMIGECCSDDAGRHSLIYPYPCTVSGCNCQTWKTRK